MKLLAVFQVIVKIARAIAAAGAELGLQRNTPRPDNVRPFRK